MYIDIFILKDKIGEVENGDVVLVVIEDWLKRVDSLFGFVICVLGKSGEYNIEIYVILVEYGLLFDFLVEVEVYV